MSAWLVHHKFWGRPGGRSLSSLSMRRDQVRYKIDAEAPGLGEWREVEMLLRRRGSHPHSVWKLMGAGSVGSQTLTGIPVLNRLRYDTRLEAISRVWPFEVVPELAERRGAVVHAEIWPSLNAIPHQTSLVKDQAQVIALAQELRHRDRSGTVARMFIVPWSAVTEEGWILGVVD